MRPPRSRSWRGPVGFAIGVALIAAAIWVLLDHSDSLSAAADAAAHASPWLIAAIIAMPVVNAAIVAWSFQIIMNRFGRVPFDDMAALIGSAWLLNYLPMRPGLVGRLAYHKAVHGISFKNAVAVSVALALMTGLAAAHLLAVWIAFTLNLALGLGVAAASIWLVFWLSTLAADHSPAGAVPRGALRVALVLRYADLVVWALRLVVAFEIIGEPIPIMVGVLLAAVIQLAYLFPLTGAGLGVAEWAVAIVAPLAITIDPASAIAASLVNRAAELVAAVPVGLIAGGFIARKRKKIGLHTPAGLPENDSTKSAPPPT